MGQLRPYQARRVTGNPVTPPEGAWIKYQLDLQRITYQTVANKANCSNSMVSDFLNSRKNSDRVKNALAEVLGYQSFDNLIAASRREAV